MHDFVLQDGFAVVSYSDSSGALESGKIRELLAKASHRSRRNRKHIDSRATFRVLHPAGDGRRIVDRRSIGHGADRGETAGRPRHGPRGNGFFVRLSGFAEMNVKVNETRCNDQAPRVEGFLGRALEFARGGHFGDASILEQDIKVTIEVLRWVEQKAV